MFSLPAALLMGLTLALFLPPAIALPQGGQVVAGQVSTAVNGAQLTLNQASRTAIMNWQSFNIASNEAVRILQSGSDAAMLARVIGGNPSELLGQLRADGKLFLINPKGILVGPGAMIDTAAFMALTLDVADADFLRQGALTFKGDSAAGVVNLGKIIAREGNVLLLAHTVKNSGEISAANGTAGLGAGTEVFLASPDAPAFVIKTSLATTTEKTGVENSGIIAAAQAQLEAAGGSIFELAVNQSGTVRATGIEFRPDGRILLTAASGNVSVTGDAVARNADGSGGEILVGGGYQGKDSAVANAARTFVGVNARLDASASSSTGDGGKVVVWSDLGTRFLGALEAKAGAAGGNGGTAEVSGKHTLGFFGTADLSAPAGARGSLLLDPDDLTIVAGTTSVSSNLTADRNWSAGEDPGAQTLGADSLTGLLATADVSLQATNSLTVNAPVVVAAGGAANVQLSLSAPLMTINQTVSLANVTNGNLYLFGSSATSLTSASGATLGANRIRLGGFPVVTLNGPVTTARLVYDMLQPATSFTATNPSNAISRFVLVGDEASPAPVNFSGNVSVHSGSALEVAPLIGSATNVTFSSTGNLTMLAADGLITAPAITASGTTKLASTGGVLINNAGASLLSGSGRRLLYTSVTTGAFTLGGLTGYSQFNGVSYPNDPNSGVTLVLYNAAGAGPVLTLTITANDFIKLYGQADPTFTASYAGGTAANLTTLPTFSIQQGAHVNVGTYTIVPSGAVSGTHTLQYVNGTLRIDPATLTYIANAASRLYGDANPVFSGTVTGFVNGDTLGSATTGTLTFTSPATMSSNAGSHAINGGGLIAKFGNYVFEDALANLSALTVNKAPLTVAFNNATRTYGAADPAFTATFTGLRNGDTQASLSGFSVGSTATAASPVGTYSIGGTTTATNYALSIVSGTLTITPAPITLMGTTVLSIYGDAPRPLGYTVAGLLNGDPASVVSGVSFDTAFFNSATPGDYSYGFASRGTAQNYVVTAVVPGKYTVLRRPVTVAAPVVGSSAGAIPPLAAATSGVVFGGPTFSVQVAAFGTGPGASTAPVSLDQQTPAGNYELVPVLVPGAGVTRADLDQYYDFNLQKGALTLDPLPVGSVILNQPAVLTGPLLLEGPINYDSGALGYQAWGSTLMGSLDHGFGPAGEIARVFGQLLGVSDPSNAGQIAAARQQFINLGMTAAVADVIVDLVQGQMNMAALGAWFVSASEADRSVLLLPLQSYLTSSAAVNSAELRPFYASVLVAVNRDRQAKRDSTLATIEALRTKEAADYQAKLEALSNQYKAGPTDAGAIVGNRSNDASQEYQAKVTAAATLHGKVLASLDQQKKTAVQDGQPTTVDRLVAYPDTIMQTFTNALQAAANSKSP
jgi:filamentous hemagglutinin family protein